MFDDPRIERCSRPEDELFDIHRELTELRASVDEIRTELTGIAGWHDEQKKWNDQRKEREGRTYTTLQTLRDEIVALSTPLMEIARTLADIRENMTSREHGDYIIGSFNQVLEALRGLPWVGVIRFLLIFAGVIAILGTLRHWF